MAHPKSAIKRHRQSLRRRDRNQGRRTTARSAVRRARELIVGGSREDAQAAVRAAGAVLDRAATKGVIHRNNASRRKSRLVRQLNRAQAGAVAETPKRGRGKAATGRSRTKKS